MMNRALQNWPESDIVIYMNSKMKLTDVPKHPAYVVFHDAFDNGAMDIWPARSFAEATERVSIANMELDAMGHDSGFYRAYEKLPRRKVYKFHA